jgi:hypothetical protein
MRSASSWRIRDIESYNGAVRESAFPVMPEWLKGELGPGDAESRTLIDTSRCDRALGKAQSSDLEIRVHHAKVVTVERKCAST